MFHFSSFYSIMWLDNKYCSNSSLLNNRFNASKKAFEDNPVGKERFWQRNLRFSTLFLLPVNPQDNRSNLDIFSLEDAVFSSPKKVHPAAFKECTIISESTPSTPSVPALEGEVFRFSLPRISGI